MALEHFRIFSTLGAKCNETLFGPWCEYQKKICSTLEIFEGDKLQTSKDDVGITDPFYKILENGTVPVGGRPVFYYDSMSENTAIKIMFFNGRRWVITSTNDIDDCEYDCNDEIEVAEKMKNFHPYRSNYSAQFMSDPVDVDTPTDTAYPNDELNWYTVRPSKGYKFQEPYLRENIGSTLRCCVENGCDLPTVLVDNYVCEKDDLEGTNIVLRLRADSYPNETSVHFTWGNQNTNNTQTNSTPLTAFEDPDKFDTKLLQYCVPEGDCGELIIIDEGGDGFLPPGGYDLFLNGKVDITDKPFTRCESFYFGDCNNVKFKRPSICT